MCIRDRYNSPFSIFFPPLENGDTIMTVTSQYVAEFNREINTLVSEHKECDIGKIVYKDYEGTSNTPSNYYDVMSVYMVKYGDVYKRQYKCRKQKKINKW